MKDYEKLIAEDGLTIEVWWESGDSEFRAILRADEIDDGWVGTGESVPIAIIMAVAAYKVDKDKAQAS